MSSELLTMSSIEIAAGIARGDFSSVEVTSFFLDRIAKHNGKLQAFCDVRPEVTLADARRHDRRSGDASTPFWGVPIAIKDLNFAGGFFTRLGSRSFQNFFSPADDQTVKRLRRAGFVVLGKTSVPEFGTIPCTEPMIHPPARNPWDLDVGPGGSSGGSASALAAGLAPIASASDGGGSIRIPAALCNLYGFKASRGRIPNPYGIDDRKILYTDGVLTRSVAETAALFDVMSGVHFGTPHWAPNAPRSFAQAHQQDPAPLRIAYSTKSPLVTPMPEAVDAVLRAAKHLQERGHIVEEREMPVADPEQFMLVWKKFVSTVRAPDESLTEPLTHWMRESGRLIPDHVAADAATRMTKLLTSAYDGIDIWLTPCVPVPHKRVGAFRNLTPQEIIAQCTEIAAFVAGYNLIGYPAASVPMGFTKQGHPFAIQVGGGALQDVAVLQISRQLEEAFPRVRDLPFGFEN